MLLAFGYCFLITIALVLAFMIVLGQNSFLLVLLLPATWADFVTGQPYVRNESKKSFIYFVMLWMFFVVQLALIASIFFGLYFLFHLWFGSNTSA